jgi:hypothetical protein
MTIGVCERQFALLAQVAKQRAHLERSFRTAIADENLSVNVAHALACWGELQFARQQLGTAGSAICAVVLWRGQCRGPRIPRDRRSRVSRTQLWPRPCPPTPVCSASKSRKRPLRPRCP